MRFIKTLNRVVPDTFKDQMYKIFEKILYYGSLLHVITFKDAQIDTLILTMD